MANKKQYFENLNPGESSIEGRSGQKIVLTNDGGININSSLASNEYDQLILNGHAGGVDFSLNKNASAVYMGSSTSSNIDLNQGNKNQDSINIKSENVIVPDIKISLDEIIIPAGYEPDTDSGAPVINSFENSLKERDPLSGKTQDTIYIKGTNFRGAKQVTFGGVNAATFEVLNEEGTEIAAIVGYGATGKVSVTNKLGTGYSEDTFTYIPTTNETGTVIESGTEGQTEEDNEGTGNTQVEEEVPEEFIRKDGGGKSRNIPPPKKGVDPAKSKGSGSGNDPAISSGGTSAQGGAVTQCGGSCGVGVYKKSGPISEDDKLYWDKIWFQGANVIDIAMRCNPQNMDIVNPNTSVPRFRLAGTTHKLFLKNFFPGTNTGTAFCAMGSSMCFAIANRGYRPELNGNKLNSGGFPLCTLSNYVRLNLCDRYILVRGTHYDTNGLKAQYLDEFKRITSKYRGSFYCVQRGGKSETQDDITCTGGTGHVGMVLGIEAIKKNDNYYTVYYYTLDFNSSSTLKLCRRTLGAAWGWVGRKYDQSTTFGNVGTYPGGAFYQATDGMWGNNIYTGLGEKDPNYTRELMAPGSWITNKGKFSAKLK